MRFLLFAFISILALKTATAQLDSIIGYIIEVRGEDVYTDLSTQSIAIGDKLRIIKEGGNFVHPITGENIKEDDETIASLEILDVRSSYSIGRVITSSSLANIQKGMKLLKFDNSDPALQNSFKKSIAVQPINVSNIFGYLGIYIGDILTEQLLEEDEFRVLDRQTLGLKMDEIVIGTGGILNEAELLKYGAFNNADYYITGTMYEPDVVELSSQIPIKSLVQVVGYTAEALTGKDLGIDIINEFVPTQSEVKNLKAIVNITLKVVDVRTGEIIFLCNEMQQEVGKSEINLEGGLLGGLKVKGGISSFRNTITGKATQKALKNLSGYISKYFKGEITTKTYTGNVIQIEEIAKKKININRRTSKDAYIMSIDSIGQTSSKVVINNGKKSNKIGKRSSFLVFSHVKEISSVTGAETVTYKSIGKLKISNIDKKTSLGNLYAKTGIVSEEGFLENSRIKFYKPFEFNVKRKSIVMYDGFATIEFGFSFYPNKKYDNIEKYNNWVWLSINFGYVYSSRNFLYVPFPPDANVEEKITYFNFEAGFSPFYSDNYFHKNVFIGLSYMPINNYQEGRLYHGEIGGFIEKAWTEYDYIFCTDVEFFIGYQYRNISLRIGAIHGWDEYEYHTYGEDFWGQIETLTEDYRFCEWGLSISIGASF